ncbi:MAG: hypothetical protein H6760_00165 [Candidatus Nomurabacteria bacterium]|nr:MAG: hypothetical protein H6760_00165 [Candidatus Nomurabacteria bacterium]
MAENRPFVPVAEQPRPNYEQSWLDRAGLADTDIGRMIRERMQYEESVRQMQRARMLIRETEVPEQSDREVYQEVMGRIVDALDESDTVKAARTKVKEEGYVALTEIEREQLVKVFERARDEAIRSVEMSDAQRSRIRFAVRSELNYSLRDHIIHGTPEVWMILDPSARPVDFMDSREILQYIRNSGAPSRDVDFVREEAESEDAPESVRQAVRELDQQAA